MDINSELKQFITGELAIDSGLDERQVGPDEDLISCGIIDSMGILKLVAFLERKFSIKLTDEDIQPDNFRTLNCLSRFVEDKQKLWPKQEKS